MGSLEWVPWEEQVGQEAAKGGHLLVLQWARGDGCPWNKWTCHLAAAGGHLELGPEVRAAQRTLVLCIICLQLCCMRQKVCVADGRRLCAHFVGRSTSSLEMMKYATREGILSLEKERRRKKREKTRKRKKRRRRRRRRK